MSGRQTSSSSCFQARSPALLGLVERYGLGSFSRRRTSLPSCQIVGNHTLLSLTRSSRPLYLCFITAKPSRAPSHSPSRAVRDLICLVWGTLAASQEPAGSRLLISDPSSWNSYLESGTRSCQSWASILNTGIFLTPDLGRDVADDSRSFPLAIPCPAQS
jgi:hypothetical protein